MTGPTNQPRKVVALLAAARGRPAGCDTTGMRETTVDLQSMIDNLRSLRSDLDAYYWAHRRDTAGTEVAYQIGFWVRSLSDRIAALEGIVLHKGSTALRIAGVTAVEEEGLKSALGVVDLWLEDDLPFHEAWRTVAAVFRAADTIALQAAGGVPADRDGRPEEP